MSASAGWNKLNAAIRTLRERVDASEELWNDRVRQNFLEDYLEPLDSQVAATLRGIKRLEEVLRQLRRDCGESRE